MSQKTAACLINLLCLAAARAGGDNCDAAYQRGLAHYREKQLDAAMTDFAGAAECEAKSQHPSSLPNIALAEAYVEKGDDNRALANYEMALRIRPDDISALRAAVIVYLRHDFNDRAAPLVERLTRLIPNDAQAHADLGAIYAASGKPAEAERQFRTALSLDPKHASAMTGLGSLLLRTDRPDDALPLLKRAAELSPDSWEPHYLLGSAYTRSGEIKQALLDMEAARERAPDEPQGHYGLAMLYGRLERTADRDKALARFSELRSRSDHVRLARRDAGLLIAKSAPLVSSGNLSAAVELLEEAQRVDPNNEQVLFRLGGLYYDVNRYNEARTTARQAIALAPSDWRYHYLAGLIEKDTGNLAQARSAFETAIRARPAAADAYNQLGDMAMRQSRPEEAIRHFERAVRIDPADTAYKLNLAAAYRAAGRK